MRVTSNMTADNALYNLQQGRSQLDKLSEQVASGLNINRPSDDPISARQVLDVENEIKAGDQYTSNITKATTFLNITSTALSGMADIVNQAKQLTDQVNNGSSDPTILQTTASQLTALKQQLIDIGNTQSGDQYVFGGFNSTTAPFSQSNNNFSGTSDQLDVEVSSNSRLTMNVSGGDVLKGTGSYGSTDILQSLDNLINAVNTNNVSGIKTGLQNLDSAESQLVNAESDVAGRLTRLTASQNMIDSSRNTLKGVISNMQTADYTKLGVELSQQQNAFQAALSSTAKITQLSLLDYLT